MKRDPQVPNLILLGLALALGGLACNTFTSLFEAAGPGTEPPPAATAAVTAPEAPPETIGPDEEPPEAPPTTTGITAAVRAQMDEIEDQVVRLRGIQSSGPVTRGLLTPEELRQRVLDDFLEDYTAEEAQNDARTLALFGLLDPSFDLYTFFTELLSEQVAGFYDDEDKQMYVVLGSEFGGLERLTHAHEYVHALQDQTYDLQDGLDYNDEACEVDSERCAAIQSLVEGDASVLEEQWLRTYGTDEDWEDIFEFFDTQQSPVYDAAPRFLQEDFLFPYTYGRDFVDRLYQEGGWAAVDAAYADPPLSTEQILHPGRYPDDPPVWLEVPDLTGALGDGWREMDQDVLGEWFTLLTLEEYLEEEIAEEAAEGWGGDYFLAFYNEALDQSALVLVTAWDSVREAHEFFRVFRDYGDARFGDHTSFSTTNGLWEGGAEHVIVEVRGDQTLWILAPDAATADALRGAVVFPAPER